MNNILQLKGSFQQRRSPNNSGGKKLPTGARVESKHIVALKEQLEEILQYWQNDSIIENPLVSVYYTRVVAKSNRIGKLLSYPSHPSNDTIVGAKFAHNELKHIITHCVKREAIVSSIEWLSKVEIIMNAQYGDVITNETVDGINSKKIRYDDSMMKRTAFVGVIVDAFYVEKFGIEEAKLGIDDVSIVSIYDTGTDTKIIMNNLGIDFYSTNMIDNTTFRLNPAQYKQVIEKAPYLVAMAVKDISDFVFDSNQETTEQDTITVPKPSNEPTIGVIDSPFDDSVYFADWVKYDNRIDPNIELKPIDYDHGTKVSSIIVDGASSNPEMDDGCGRFKVRHFGVATSGPFSSFTVIKAIKEIVAENPDIKVWNLSLGSRLEIKDNFISPEAAVLDQIQYENDVVFVVAGTNKGDSKKQHMKIGAPADSINSMVVNATDKEGNPASYSREGMVLSFFNKPDVSYFGGDRGSGIRVCSPTGEAFVVGTSFAAPWIARKLAYLIHVMGMTRELAKALLIDSAVGWTEKTEPSKLLGYGIVPQHIEEIISSSDEEIRFLLSGTSEQYDTYSYNIPVPVEKNKHPYIARATMCYFPKCSRSQGVDYTNTELDLHFGRMNEGGEIDTINDNKQSNEGFHNITESNARAFYRKWDNVKYIIEYDTGRKRSKKAYSSNMYGISIKTKERLKKRDGEGVMFGIVITLKELNEKNRIDEFARQCRIKGWIVNQIDINNKVNVYQTAEEELQFDE